MNIFCGGDFTSFLSKTVQIWDKFSPWLFPKDSKYVKSLDIGLWQVVAKRPLNGVNKWEDNKNFTPLLSTKVQIWDHFFITFLRGFWISKQFRHGISRNGGKKTFKRSMTNKFPKIWRRKKEEKKLYLLQRLYTILRKKLKSKTTSLPYFSPRIPNI